MFFLVVIAPLFVIGWIFNFGTPDHKTKSRQMTALELIFGDELNKLATEPSNRQVLSLRDEWLTRDDGGSYFVKRTALVRYNHSQYAFLMLFSDQSNRLVEPISELRARRALFNHPANYEAAFGSLPDRKDLQPLIVMEQKLDAFDTALHGKELHAQTPIGKEFGARVR